MSKAIEFAFAILIGILVCLMGLMILSTYGDQERYKEILRRAELNEAVH